jgi:hypothetical protein
MSEEARGQEALVLTGKACRMNLSQKGKKRTRKKKGCSDQDDDNARL